MTYSALGNLPISGGSSSAPTGTSAAFSSRSLVNTQASLNPGEILSQTAIPQNPIFDWSIGNSLNVTVLNQGFGDVRAMTQAELSALSNTTNASISQFNSDVAFLKAAYTTITGYVSAPGSAPTTVASLEAQLFPLLLRLLRALDYVSGDVVQIPH